jgi:hypothetical protein
VEDRHDDALEDEDEQHPTEEAVQGVAGRFDTGGLGLKRMLQLASGPCGGFAGSVSGQPGLV